MGKTWLVEAIGRSAFEDVATVDFERNPDAASLFTDPTPAKNVRAVEAFLGKRIEPGRTLLFLDEVQAAPKVLGRLRYFYEELPQLHVVAAGSLLDFTLAQPEFQVPVGRISYLHLEPLSYPEYLAAVGEDELVDLLRQCEPDDPDPVPPAIHQKLLRLVREYVLTGGMPAAVNTYCSTQSWVEVSRVHQDLLATLRDDFRKYSTGNVSARLGRILDAIPLQVGQKFKFSRVDREDRAAPLRQALDLLAKARVCHRVQCSHGNGVPLAAEVDGSAFKVVLLDTGLLFAALRLRPEQIEQVEDVTLVNEGSVAEHLVGQMLRTLEPSYIEPQLHYWKRDKKGSAAEVDYLLQHDGRVVPIEVKAGSTGALRSLHLFVNAKGLELAVRVHSRPAEVKEVTGVTPTGGEYRYRLLSIPFYLVHELPRLLDAV